jgi:uncharacterized membrane-anchored protein
MTSSVSCEPSRVRVSLEQGEKNMTRTLAWMVGLSTVAAILLASVAGLWLTNDLRVVGLVIVGITPIAAGLVGYFEWRANLRRKALADRQDDRRVA